MTAAIDSRNDKGLGTGARYYELLNQYLGPVAASVNLPHGTIAAMLTADTNVAGPVVYPFTISASKTAIGFVDVGFDNTSGEQGARPVAVTQRTGALVDLNAGGGSAIAQTDRFKVAYGVDNQTVSKLAADGEAIGMIIGLNEHGAPVIGVGPVFLMLARAFALAASGVTFTQTYSTADTTVPSPTATSLTDSSGGATADGTIGAVTAPTAQTDSSGGSANATLAAQTLPTDVTIGTLSGTANGALESIGATNGGDVSGAISNNFKEFYTAQAANLAQLTALRNVTTSYAARQAENRTAIIALTDAVKELATVVNELVADSLQNRKLINKLIDVDQAIKVAG